MLSCQPAPPERLSEADRITWKLSDPSGEDRKWREKQFAKLPFLFQLPTAKTYKKIFRTAGRTAANVYLREIVGELKNLDIQLATNEDFIRQYIKNRVTECRAIAARSESEEIALEKASAIAKTLGFTPPKICKTVSTIGALARLCDERWWHRQISNTYPEKFEAAAIRCGMVHKKSGLYVSNESFHAFTARRARSNRILGFLEIVNEEDQSYALSELVERSVSNPKNRRNELMARLYGFDLIAKALGNLGLFITITCPSRMHSRYKKTGDLNPNYNKTTPSQAQKYLCTVWSRIRAKLKHAGMHILPHSDH